MGCFAVAQSLLLDSREPLRPLALYGIGGLLLLPALNAPCQDSLPPVKQERQATLPVVQSRGLFRWAFALTAIAVGVALAKPDAPNPIQFGVAAVCVGVVIYLLHESAPISTSGDKPPVLERVIGSARHHAAELAAVAFLTGVAFVIQSQTPAPGSALSEHNTQSQAVQSLVSGSSHTLYSDGGALYLYVLALAGGQTPHLNSLQRVSSLFAVLLVPAVYLLGSLLARPLVGFFAAGFAAVSLWTLALGKVGNVFSALALCSAAFLCALFWTRRTRRREAYMICGLALGIGWVTSPHFVYMMLLLPIMDFLAYLDQQKDGAAAQRRSIPVMLGNFAAHFSGMALAFIVTLALALPILVNHPGVLPRRDLPLDYAQQVGVTPSMTTADALFGSLLLFNLTGDPNPLHGVVDRPVFAPVMAAAFLLGLLALAWRLHRVGRWSDVLLLAALVVGVLPSALAIEPPLHYPDLQKLALALPAAVMIAALGIDFLARMVESRWGRAGILVVLAAFLLGLLTVFTDASHHYINVFLPAYELAAPAYEQIYGGG
jgi:hypothetical protein